MIYMCKMIFSVEIFSELGSKFGHRKEEEEELVAEKHRSSQISTLCPDGTNTC